MMKGLFRSLRPGTEVCPEKNYTFHTEEKLEKNIKCYLNKMLPHMVTSNQEPKHEDRRRKTL